MIQELIDTWDYLVEYGVATEDELKLITSINGMNSNTLDEVMYARTGYNSIEQLKEEG